MPAICAPRDRARTAGRESASSRQRDLLAANEEPASSKTTDATRLLSGWHQDEEYLEAGRPMALPIAGPAPSFQSLFAAYGGDTPEQTLVRELRNAGSVGEDDEGRLIPLRRYHMPAAIDEGAIRFFGTNLYDHANALSNNLADDGRPKRLEGFAVEASVDARYEAAFRAYIDERGQQFLEEIDDWLTRHSIAADDADASTVRLGLGIYGIEGPLPKGTLS